MGRRIIASLATTLAEFACLTPKRNARDDNGTESQMEEVKILTQSKTFWGAIIALCGSALSLGHYTLTPAEAAQTTDLLSGIATAIGGLIAIYGRVVATKKIGGHA